jgi:hypothetical protein
VSNSASTVPGTPDPLRRREVGSASVTTLSLAQLRQLRRRLRDESDRAAHWHRLARARLDLAVADALADDMSGPATLTGSPVTDEEPAPCFASMRQLLLGDEMEGSDVVDRLRRFDDAERVLRGYGSSVRAAANEATFELVRRYAQKPAICLEVARDHA